MDLALRQKIIAILFAFKDFWWYYRRPLQIGGRPVEEGHPRYGETEWAMFEDHISVLIERGYFTWESSGKASNFEKIMVSPD